MCRRKIHLTIVLFMHVLYSYSQNCNDTVFSGEGTFYGGIAGGSSGNCSLPVEVGDYYHCAINDSQYDNSNACGAFINVRGPNGKITLKVVDRCPECLPGDIDMTQEAFAEIANIIDGRVPISWQFVPANSNETIKVNFKTGSSEFWTAIQFRNLEHSIVSMDYQKEDGTWEPTNRALFNFFIEPSGIPSPMNLRITSVLCEQLLFKDIILNVEEDYDTMLQFSTPSDCNSPNTTFNPTIIYPNPTHNFLYIKSKLENSWVLMDVNGKCIQKGHTNTIDLQEYSKGLYFLNINKQIMKVIKF